MTLLKHWQLGVHRRLRSAAWGIAAVSLLLLQGCATVANPDPRDPLESFNRSVYGFNDVVDRAVLKPVATAYRDVLPSWARRGVTNFFGNLDDVWSAVNSGLQMRGQAFGDSVGRVMVNTTIGLGGLIDVASDLNIDKHTSNFSLTLGKWGVGAGPYVVLPLLGPFTLREVAALPIDQQGNLITHVPDEGSRTAFTVVDAVSTRANYLGAGDVVDGAALDRYSFTRDAYLQRQRYLVYDGNPPEEEGE
jgi:phospholipid-binding lipoprotein MlaA